MYDTKRILPPDEVERRVYGAPIADIHKAQRPISAGAMEALNNMERGRLALEAQRKEKEKQMPDIKTALQNALSKTAADWAADDEAHQKIDPVQVPVIDKRVTNNISRTVFNFIHANPGVHRQKARDALLAQGFKDTSVTSLISQMIRTRMVRMDENEALHTNVPEYIPIPVNSGKVKRKVVQIVRKPRTEPVVPEPLLLTGVTPLPTLPSAESILTNMSVGEAYKLYQELHKMFGGK